jgi:D-3-phosphoglycerate dehydrogenase
VFNAPFSNTRSVVELAIAEIIALTRRLTEKNAAMHDGVWDKAADGSHEVRGRSLGIVGYGNIGTQLSVLAENLGMRCPSTTPPTSSRSATRSAATHSTSCSKVRHRHAARRRPGRQQRLLRRGAVLADAPAQPLLNLSRGFVIDHEALRRHLDNGHVAGAAVDVFPTEPKGRGDEFHSTLRGLPNVILTPHIGGSTERRRPTSARSWRRSCTGTSKRAAPR